MPASHTRYGDISTHKSSGDHDSRYALKSHNHDSVYSKTNHSHAWSAITSKPSTFTPSSHTHDDRYYTESEINNKLKDFIITKEFTSSNMSVSANSGRQVPIGMTVPSGYKFFCVAATKTNGAIAISYFAQRDNNTLTCYTFNAGSSAATYSVTATALFIKS